VICMSDTSEPRVPRRHETISQTSSLFSRCISSRERKGPKQLAQHKM
jgi:hypothetical protein